MKKAGADLAKLSVEELKKRERAAMQELSRGLSANNFARFKPLPFQQPWYESDAKVRALVGGNRIGKSTYRVITVLSACLGTRPIALGGEIPARWPRDTLKGHRFLAAGESFDLALKETIIPKLEQFVTSDMLARKPIVRDGMKVECPSSPAPRSLCARTSRARTRSKAAPGGA